MRHSDRSGFRKLARDAAILFGLIGLINIWATPGTLLPAILSMAVAAVLALVAVGLPDGLPRPCEMGDYEDGDSGAVRDDSPASDRHRRA